MIKYEFSRYDDYKDSGVEWLGDVPEHWIIKRVKDLALLQSGTSIVSEQIEVEDSYPVYGGNGLRGYYSRYTNNGDHILIGRQGALCGNINYAQGKFWASEHAVVAYLNNRVVMKWYGEMLKVMNLNQYSLSAAQPGLAMDRIKRLLLPVPPFHEQKNIAHYLDTKTTQIDRKIDLLTQKGTKYGKLKQSLINETVTRGLDKTVVMKDSGVEWIGEMPAHWEVKRVKDVFIESKNKAGCKSSSYKVLSLTLKGVIVRNLENNKGKIPASFDGYQIIQKNNIVFCLFDMDVTPRIVGYVEEEGIITSAYTVVKNKTNISMKYYYYYFLEQNRNKSLLSNSKTLRSTLTFDAFSLLRLPNAPYGEQKAIADYLDTKTTQIDNIIASINTQIEKLKELRKTLINDVVTGKIKVCKKGETI